MSFDAARRLADTVLFEGYVLYPYRASSAKNRYRHPFGVLAPSSWSAAGGCEAAWMEAQCLVEGEQVTVTGLLRFLHSGRRRVEETSDNGATFRDVEQVQVENRRLVSWDEAELREIELRASCPLTGELTIPFDFEGSSETELVRDERGELRARITRVRHALEGRIRVRAERTSAPRPLWRLSVRVENVTPWELPRARREEVLGACCLSTHVMLRAEGGAFLSVQDPPVWASSAAASCKSVRSFPVLAGAAGATDLVLASPIILYDHAITAPESPTDFFDGTEIDELLTLRTQTLTEEEQAQARATDPRAAALLDRVMGMSPKEFARLHGAQRDIRGPEMVPLPRPQFAPGSRVRLRPGKRRTDAQDLLYAGRVATVEKVMRDVDDREILAVTIDDDPAAELHRWYGRFHYYEVDEVEALPANQGSPP